MYAFDGPPAQPDQGEFEGSLGVGSPVPARELPQERFQFHVQASGERGIKRRASIGGGRLELRVEVAGCISDAQTEGLDILQHGVGDPKIHYLTGHLQTRVKEEEGTRSMVNDVNLGAVRYIRVPVLVARTPSNPSIQLIF